MRPTFPDALGTSSTSGKTSGSEIANGLLVAFLSGLLIVVGPGSGTEVYERPEGRIRCDCSMEPREKRPAAAWRDRRPDSLESFLRRKSHPKTASSGSMRSLTAEVADRGFNGPDPMRMLPSQMGWRIRLNGLLLILALFLLCLMPFVFWHAMTSAAERLHLHPAFAALLVFTMFIGGGVQHSDVGDQARRRAACV